MKSCKEKCLKSGLGPSVSYYLWSFGSLAGKTFNHVVRLLVARLYDVYVRLPLTEEEWEFELRGFIENYALLLRMVFMSMYLPS